MAIRENTFLLKRSNVPGKVPLPGDIQLGEVALNTSDVKLYASGTTENDIVQIGWDRINRTGDTVTGDFIFNGGITATTISATTYSNYPNDLPTGGTAGQILAKIDSVNYNVEWIENYTNYTSTLKHEVKAGEAINKGQAVYVSSADGTNMIVSKASNVSEATSSKTMGLLAQNLATNDKGFLITEGLLTGLNTSAAGAAGDPVWLGVNGDLIYGLINKPYAPAHLVFIGIVTRKNNVNGEIFVKVQNGFELKEIHDVDLISNAPTGGDQLQYDSTTSLWKNTKPFWTIDLMDNSSVEFYTVQDVKINTITNIVGSPTITIADDGTPYTLTNTILSGSKITVTSNIQSVVKLNITY